MEIRHSEPLFFIINDERFCYFATESELGLIEIFAKGEDYILELINGNFVVKNLKTREEICSGEDVMFVGGDPAISNTVIGSCLDWFGLLDMCVGDDLFESTISWRIYCENKELEQELFDEYMEAKNGTI